MERYVLTIEDREELQKILIRINNEYERVAKAGYESGSEQDGHHDEGFQLSKQSSEVLFIQLQKIQEIIENSRVVVPDEQNASIQLGNGFIIEYEDDGSRMGFVMSGYSGDFLDKKKKLSTKSPLGRSLLGKKKSDVIEVKLPTKTRRVKIIEIFSPSTSSRAFS